MSRRTRARLKEQAASILRSASSGPAGPPRAPVRDRRPRRESPQARAQGVAWTDTPRPWLIVEAPLPARSASRMSTARVGLPATAGAPGRVRQDALPCAAGMSQAPLPPLLLGA